MAIYTAVMVVAGAAVWVFAPNLIGLFDENSVVIREGGELLRVMVLSSCGRHSADPQQGLCRCLDDFTSDDRSCDCPFDLPDTMCRLIGPLWRTWCLHGDGGCVLRARNPEWGVVLEDFWTFP